ncbi:MAG: F0F1 ATP synthase subunit A [Phycisphaerales bacterium]|nr:F0F1 ATP synthase subunit A [Phycisphaerales bacterium]
MIAILASSNPLTHVVQHPYIQYGSKPGLFTSFTLLSNQIAMMILAALLLIGVVVRAGTRRRGRDGIDALVPKGFGNFLELVCEYLRNEVARPALGAHTDRFIKYIWTVFFFIFTCNLLGLMPFDAIGYFLAGMKPVHIGGTATANIFTTVTLAVCTLLMMVVNGLRIGGTAYLAHFCPGPLYMAPLLVPVEILGTFAKIFALSVRLFANMMAGHILLAVLLGFTASAFAAGAMTGVGVTIPVVLGSVAINFLELFVAALQAFIFAFLTTLFIGMSVNVHHDDHGHGDHEHHDPELVDYEAVHGAADASVPPAH